MTCVLGMPLDRALEQCRALGDFEVRVVRTAPPRGACEGGTPRVVRQRPGEWTVAAFPDRVSQKERED